MGVFVNTYRFQGFAPVLLSQTLQGKVSYGLCMEHESPSDSSEQIVLRLNEPQVLFFQCNVSHPWFH